MTEPQNELDRIHSELEQVRAALSDRRVGLFASKRLYARLGALLREQESLEAEPEPMKQHA